MGCGWGGHDSDSYYFLYRLSRHCRECQFDACRWCFHRHITTLHQHPLFRADSYFVYPRSSGGWGCDNCRSLHHDPADNWPWHCHTCKYDLCDNCIGAVLGVKKGDQACDLTKTFIFLSYNCCFSVFVQSFKFCVHLILCLRYVWKTEFLI